MKILPFKSGDKVLSLATTSDHQAVILCVNGKDIVELTIDEIVAQCCFEKKMLHKMMDSPGTAWPTTFRIISVQHHHDQLVYLIGDGTFEDPKHN